MTSLLDRIGEKLADKWISALAVPGLLLMATAAVATELGQRSALDLAVLRERAGHWGAAAAGWSTLGQLTALAVVVLGSVAVGTVVRSCAQGVERLWAGDWPRIAAWPARRLTAARQRRWDLIQQQIEDLRDARPPRRRDADDRLELDGLTARRDRIALARPSGPTYSGDQLAATATRLHHQYGIDLAACWTLLWLILPDEVRTELRAARIRFVSAVEGTTWAACCLALGLQWWPAAVGGTVVGLAARSRGRSAAATYARLVESTVDLHLARLMEELKVDPSSPAPDLRMGVALTRMARKAS